VQSPAWHGTAPFPARLIFGAKMMTHDFAVFQTGLFAIGLRPQLMIAQ